MMKKLIRALPLKLLAVLLCMASAGGITYLLADAFTGEQPLYLFEGRYEDSYYVRDTFYSIVSRVWSTVYRGADDAGELAVLDQELTEDAIEYYAVYGNKELTITNTNISDPAYYKTSQAYLIFDWPLHIESSGSMAERNYGSLNRYGPNEDFQIYLKIKDDVAAQQAAHWEAAREKMNHHINMSIVLFVSALAAFIYLLFVAGKRPEDEAVHLVLIDRMYVEFNLALLILPAVGAAALGLTLLEPVVLQEFGEIAVILNLLALIAAAETGVLLALSLSLVRNMKNRTFLQRSCIVQVTKFLWKLAVKIIRWACGLVKRFFAWLKRALRRIGHALRAAKNGVISDFSKDYRNRNVLLLFLAYSAALFFLTMLFTLCIDTDWFFPFLLILLLAGGAMVFISRRLKGFEELREGIAKIKNGDLNYKIENCPPGVLLSMAEDVNTIGEGLVQSLENEIKSERMKSELITNVSHDLKTPLTSIINYADLLCKEDLKPEEANDYAAIIRQKGEKLKNLTADLFDISKVQSGTETIVREKIDLCLLMRQTLGEYDSNIRESGLEFVTAFPEGELFVTADGKKLSRVFENLVCNCLKYTLPHTRVYVRLAEEDGNAVVELKNIANYKMEFADDEITERFVRGDASRTMEGSGLGLAIAKSYVEVMGGTLRVRTDGDLFKVMITMKCESQR